eukprot:jgi/Astpho2/396/Aster-x0925
MKTRAADRMKRKATSRTAPVQAANKLSSSKGKQVAGIPVDTDQEAHEAMTPQPGSFSQHLLKGFAAMWDDRSQLADVILSVGDQQVLAHSCVLCMWSEVFKALLTRWSAQRTSNGAAAAAVTVDLSPGDSPEDFLELLHYCYVGTCQLDSHNVMPLLRLSNYYEILPLKETCGEFLFELLTACNCLNLLLKLIEKYMCTRERRMLIQHMAQNFEGLLEEGALWQLPCRVWQEILMQDCLVVANESAVLTAAWQYDTYIQRAQLQKSNSAMGVAIDSASNGMRDSVMERLLPCVRLPQLGLTMLLDRVEQNTWLMSLDVTKEYLANAFRSLLLTKEGKAAKPLAVAGSAAGSSNLGDSEGGDGRLACGRAARAGRRQASTAPTQRATVWASSWSVGGAAPQTATAEAEGGLKMAWKSRDGLAPDAPHLCYTKVQPGLQYGSMYIELLVQSTRPSSRGISGLKFWVVRDPRVVPRSPSSDDPASLVWDCNGTNYGRMNRADATGQNGTVQLVASGSRPGGRPFALQFVAVPVDKYRIMGDSEELSICFLMWRQGDIIGVGSQARERLVLVTFHKNGMLMAKQKVCSACMAHNGDPNGQWHVMRHAWRLSAALLRPPPTQAAKPSTARVPEGAQPAAQLDAQSQAERQSATLKMLMTAAQALASDKLISPMSLHCNG